MSRSLTHKLDYSDLGLTNTCVKQVPFANTISSVTMLGTYLNTSEIMFPIGTLGNFTTTTIEERDLSDLYWEMTDNQNQDTDSSTCELISSVPTADMSPMLVENDGTILLESTQSSISYTFTFDEGYDCMGRRLVYYFEFSPAFSDYTTTIDNDNN